MDEEGKVTAKADGTAVVTVTTVDGNKTAICSVTVEIPKDPMPDQIQTRSNTGTETVCSG